jgi:hypothetical protein
MSVQKYRCYYGCFPPTGEAIYQIGSPWVTVLALSRLDEMNRGVARIVDQTVDRKIISTIEPAVESAVLKVLGVDNAGNEGDIL